MKDVQKYPQFIIDDVGLREKGYSHPFVVLKLIPEKINLELYPRNNN